VLSFFEKWRHVVMNNLKVSYKVKMELIHRLGITKTNTYDVDGLHNIGLTNSWKQIWEMLFVKQYEYNHHLGCKL
jgi:hypothetical protein